MRLFHYECCHGLSYSALHAGAAKPADPPPDPFRGAISWRDDPGARSNGKPVTRRGGLPTSPAPIEPRREASISELGSQLSPSGDAAWAWDNPVVKIRAALRFVMIQSVRIKKVGVIEAGERRTGQSDLSVRSLGLKQETG